MSESFGIADTIAAKSIQLNADDLMNGPITVQITGVSVARGDQPVTISISGGYQPWKPCKTSRRLLVFGWGGDEQKYVGRWLTLYRDPDALWAGKPAGGVRHSAMSEIKGAFTLPLSHAKGKKTEYRITVLTPPANGKPSVDPAFAAFFDTLVTATKAGGWTNDQIKALLGCPAAEVSVERRAEIVAIIANPPEGGAS